MFGAVVGVYAAHAMFAELILQVSLKLRDGPSQVFSELVATFGLLATILGALRFRPEFTPAAVGLFITAAYWFTASTSFANPAVTIARSLSDTFAGIAPSSAPAFVGAQLARGGPRRGRLRLAFRRKTFGMIENFSVAIFHNPNCGTSRNVVAMVQAAGYAPLIIEYLKAGRDRPLLESFLTDMPATARDLLREKGTQAAALGCSRPK